LKIRKLEHVNGTLLKKKFKAKVAIYKAQGNAQETNQRNKQNNYNNVRLDII
jgi:hypothetical protein